MLLLNNIRDFIILVSFQRCCIKTISHGDIKCCIDGNVGNIFPPNNLEIFFFQKQLKVNTGSSI